MGWTDPFTVDVNGDSDPASLKPAGVNLRPGAIVMFKVPETPALVYGGPNVTFAGGIPLTAGDLFVSDFNDGPPHVQADTGQTVTLNPVIKGTQE